MAHGTRTLRLALLLLAGFAASGCVWIVPTEPEPDPPSPTSAAQKEMKANPGDQRC